MSTETKPDKPASRLRQLLSASGQGSKRRKLLLLGGVAFVLVLVLGYPMYRHAVTHESTEDAFVEARVVSISPQVSGHMARVLVTDNQQVKQGELLAEIDPRNFQVALDIAEANLQSAQATLSQAEASASAAQNILAQKGADLSSQHAGLAQVRASVAEVKAGQVRDANDLKRMASIAEAGAVSRQEYDHAKAQADMTKAKLNSARRQVDTQAAKIDQAQASVLTAQDQLREALSLVEMRRAELRSAKAKVDQAKLNLSYTRITAPCDGYITKKALEAGNYVQTGQKLFSIVSSEAWVIANFKETQISNMQAGQPVEVEVDAYPDMVFEGRVDSIQRGTGSRFTLLPPENATGNFIKVVQRVPVKIVLTSTEASREHLLAPGMSAVPSVDISQDGSAQAKAAATKLAAVE